MVVKATYFFPASLGSVSADSRMSHLRRQEGHHGKLMMAFLS